MMSKADVELWPAQQHPKCSLMAFISQQVSPIPTVCAGSYYGAVVEDVQSVVYKAGDQVKAVFQSACPRNNVRLESTFLTVERQDDEDEEQWEVVSVWVHPGTMPCPCPYQEALLIPSSFWLRSA